MKKFGDSAIHDEGFQFFLTIEMGYYIETLIHDIKVLEECVLTHKEWGKKKWYTSKTTVGISDYIDGYTIRTEFTLKECNNVLSHKKSIYEAFIKVSEKALKDAIDNKNDKYYKPFYEDLERKNVIIEDNPIVV